MKFPGCLCHGLRGVLCALAIVAMMASEAGATHLRAGEITVVRESCSSLTFIITITVYTNTLNTDVIFGGAALDFGDSNSVVVPLTPNTPRPDLNPDGSVATATFTVRYTYAGVGRYLIRYAEPNRNRGVLNILNSVQNAFYLETEILIDPALGCNSTPVPTIAPVDHGCKGVLFTHNPGAVDADNDSLSYELATPYQRPGVVVTGYKSPDDPSFYMNYETASEDGLRRPTFGIDPVSGTVSWDAPGAIGEYNIAFHMIEWRKRSGRYYRVGYVRRDMQIIIDDCDNRRPDIFIPADTCITAGTTLDFGIMGTDPDRDDVRIEVFSVLLGLKAPSSPATYSPVPGVQDFRPSPAITRFQWNSQCEDVRQGAYQVVFKISDKPDRGGSLVTFKTWNIRVVGPAPVWQSAQLTADNRAVALQWDAYQCTNAVSMQVWRKVDGANFEPDYCMTGMPAGLGYQRIGNLPLNTGTAVNNYTDDGGTTGLPPGARYCYRMVAVFPSGDGSLSYVSKDVCIDPIPALVPVITHVTVDKTDESAGEIRVSWRKPFNADPVQYPGPYHYRIYRASGLTRDAATTEVTPPGIFTDTTFVDRELNTFSLAYNYSVVAIADNGVATGSSAVASSVRLEVDAGDQRIALTWQAVVPWSNVRDQTPSRHLIYRGPEGAVEADLVLIDSVNVSSGIFTYTDAGQWNGQPLAEGQTYCYKVMTRGGYGNPDIEEPLNNFSHMICTQPGDTIPPCRMLPPVRSILDFASCDEFIQKYCARDFYTNIITWDRINDASCRKDVKSYNLYAAASAGGEFSLIAEHVQDTFYIDDKLLSLARCYKIAAVDVSGNVGELSEAMCVDNCPYYELPNVFTPNKDGFNDVFSAYSTRGYCDGEEGCPPVPPELKLKCARFVQSVNFTVFNRWGQEVYTYRGSDNSDDNTIFIDWDGTNNGGGELSTGLYYYIAEVTFDVIDPRQTMKTFKGWVHLKR